MEKVLETVFKQVKKVNKGKRSNYIPELAKVDPNLFAISIVSLKDKKIYSVGDYKSTVSIQSVAKVFTLALALQKKGIDYINKKIGSDGSFFQFNSTMAIELSKSRTLNPFVNAGAIATTSLLWNKNNNIFWKNIRNNMNDYAGRELKISKSVYKSESKTNIHNKSLAYLLKSYDRFYGDVDDSVDVYTKQGSMLVNSEDIAIMAATLANDGKNPITKKKIINKRNIPYILGQMVSAGMYNYSDNWILDVGIPAKSGVSGIIMCVVPGICGIGIVSPKLDKNGNSIRGIKAAEMLSKSMNLSLFTKSEC